MRAKSSKEEAADITVGVLALHLGAIAVAANSHKLIELLPERIHGVLGLGFLSIPFFFASSFGSDDALVAAMKFSELCEEANQVMVMKYL